MKRLTKYYAAHQNEHALTEFSLPSDLLANYCCLRFFETGTQFKGWLSGSKDNKSEIA